MGSQFSGTVLTAAEEEEVRELQKEVETICRSGRLSEADGARLVELMQSVRPILTWEATYIGPLFDGIRYVINEAVAAESRRPHPDIEGDYNEPRIA